MINDNTHIMQTLLVLENNNLQTEIVLNWFCFLLLMSGVQMKKEWV